MIASNGPESFAFFIYEDPEQILNIVSEPGALGEIGFSAGDLRRSSTLTGGLTRFPTMNFNAFRIDGRPWKDIY